MPTQGRGSSLPGPVPGLLRSLQGPRAPLQHQPALGEDEGCEQRPAGSVTPATGAPCHLQGAEQGGSSWACPPCTSHCRLPGTCPGAAASLRRQTCSPCSDPSLYSGFLHQARKNIVSVHINSSGFHFAFFAINFKVKVNSPVGAFPQEILPLVHSYP